MHEGIKTPGSRRTLPRSSQSKETSTSAAESGAGKPRRMRGLLSRQAFLGLKRGNGLVPSVGSQTSLTVQPYAAPRRADPCDPSVCRSLHRTGQGGLRQMAETRRSGRDTRGTAGEVAQGGRSASREKAKKDRRRCAYCEGVGMAAEKMVPLSLLPPSPVIP